MKINKRIITNVTGILTVPGLYYGLLIVFSGAGNYLTTASWRLNLFAVSLIGAVLWSVVVAIWHKRLYDNSRSKYERALFMFVCHPILMFIAVVLFSTLMNLV